MNRLYLFLGFLLAVFPPASADRLVFVDGLELDGTVLKRSERDFTVRVEYGKIKIPRSRIDRMNLDAPQRLSELESSDTRGLLELADLCKEFGDEETRLRCLTIVAENENVPEDRVLELINIYEKKGMQQHLEIALRRYLEINPGRQDIAEKLERIEAEAVRREAARKKLEEEARKKAAEEAKKKKEAEKLALAKAKLKKEEEAKKLAMATPKVAAKSPTAPTVRPLKEAVAKKVETPPEDTRPEVTEGLEINRRWRVQNWGNPGKFEIVDQGGEKKNLVAKISFTKARHDKVAIRLNYLKNLTEKQNLVFDAYNGSEGSIRIAVAFVTLPGWKFYESFARTVRPKNWATQLKVPLQVSKFKSLESNWVYNTPLQHKDNTAQIMFIMYHNVSQGHVFLDNIHFEPEDPAAPQK